MDPDLDAALAPVLADLAATCRATLVVQDDDRAGDGFNSAMLWAPDGTGSGVSVVVGDPPADQVVNVADQVQDAAIEALWMSRLPPTWPQCPHHPDTHPLAPALVAGDPVWRCPAGGRVVARIGSLRPELGEAEVRRLERASALAVAATEYADVPGEVVERLRARCLALPEVTENEAWAGIQWRVRKRTFAHVLTVDFPEGPVTVMTFRSSAPERTALLGGGLPFFRPKWGRDGVGLVLGAGVDWDEVTELVTESYCVVAPKKLVGLLDHPDRPPR